MPVWVAMVGVHPGSANRVVFGDTKGVFIWVASRAASADDFRRLLEAEMKRQGLSVDEVSDVTLAQDALKERHGAEIDWERLIAKAEASPRPVIAPNFYFYEQD